MTDSSIVKLHHTLKELSLQPVTDKFATGSKIRDAFYNYQLGHCYHPQTIYVQDSFTGYLVKKEVPCGSCYYCRNNKINEWVTRCYAHLADFKNAYFITLTYAPYYNRRDSVSHYMLNYLKDALFHGDSLNETERFGYGPCVLCKKHYQDFFKRLRKNTGFDDITYNICGEYGTKFGRPHFHAIIFTNHVLTAQDIKRAWSVALVHKTDGTIVPKTSNKCAYFWDADRRNEDYYFYQSIGRVSFDDLVNNGTLSNEDILIDGVKKNAHHCFAYVCKYCAKAQYNERRLSLAYDQLKQIKSYYDKESQTCATERFTTGSVDEFARVRREQRINEEVRKSPLFIANSEQLFTKSRPDLVVSDGYLSSGVLAALVPEDAYDWHFPTTFREFVSAYGCFMSVSRGCPIGSLYVKTHLDEMAQGRFSQPPLQTEGFVVPKYFLNKVDSYIYGLRKINSRGNAQKGNLNAIARLFDTNNSSSSITDFCTNHHQHTALHELLHSEFCFVDAHTKERMLIFESTWNNARYFRVNSYRYNRSLRKYDFVCSYGLDAWLAKYSTQLVNLFDRHRVQEAICNKNNLLKSHCISILSKYADYLPVIDKVDLSNRVNLLSNKELNILFELNNNLSVFERFARESVERLNQNVIEHNKHLKFYKHTDNA